MHTLNKIEKVFGEVGVFVFMVLTVFNSVIFMFGWLYLLFEVTLWASIIPPILLAVFVIAVYIKGSKP